MLVKSANLHHSDIRCSDLALADTAYRTCPCFIHGAFRGYHFKLLPSDYCSEIKQSRGAIPWPCWQRGENRILGRRRMEKTAEGIDVRRAESADGDLRLVELTERSTKAPAST